MAPETGFGPLKQIEAGLLDVGYVEQGPANGQPVLLLHGWPYDIHAFAEVTPALAEAGYRVIVPYLRGYGTTRFLSPNTMRNGQPAALGVDAVALLDALGIEAAVIGGLSEIIVAYEEYCVPIYSDIPDEQIAMLADTGAVGIAATDFYDPVQIGQNVVIFGAGPIGLAAVQGAKAKAAGQIIVVEPARSRREMAAKFGASAVLDPNQDTATLVDRIREMCKARTDRLDAGGQVPGNNRFSMRGADLVIDCSGYDRFPPKVEPGPDPSGLLALRQAWEVTAPGGSLVTLAVQNGDIAFPGAIFCLSGRRIFGGQMAGMNVMRDTPRFITAMEKGQVDIGALVTSKRPLSEVKQGFQGVADRTELGVVITFPG